MMIMASPSGMFSLMASSVGGMLGFSCSMLSRVYDLWVGYITLAWTVSTSMDQSFSFEQSSKFIWHQR